jgi:hypothetical protein
VSEDQQGLPEELEKEIEDFFGKNPEQAGFFAARCALRALPACIGDDGRPLFSETPKKHFFAVLRTGVYAWLWRSPGFPSSAAAADAAAADDAAFAAAAAAAYAAADDAAYAAARAAAAYAYAAAYAAAAAAAAAARAARAGTIKYIEADLRAIQSGNEIQFSTLSPLLANESETGVVDDDFSQKIQSLYGDGIAYIYSCIVQGGEDAENVFNNADQVYEYCESVWNQLEAGSFKPDDYQDSLSFLEFNNNETNHKGSTEEVSDHKVELIKQYIAGNTFAAEAVAIEDHLNRQPLADAVMKWLTEKENTSNINLALFGEWGVGKSTFLNMLMKSDLESKANRHSENNKSHEAAYQVHLIWGEFNAWRYEHSDNIQAGITQEAVKALKSQLGWLGRLRLTTQYAFKSHPLQLVLLSVATLVTMMAMGVAGYYGLADTSGDLTTAAIAVGVPAQLFVFWFLYQKAQGIFSHPLADKLNTYLRLPSFGEHLGSIPVMRDQVALLTQLRFNIPSLIATGHRWWGKYRKSGKHQRLIFIVDDLDRCSPEGVVKTLEAIRLVMELDNVVVIIAIDQRVALASLAKHYEPLEKHHLLDAHEIARDYLAKVIHIPIVLEQPSENDIEHYLMNHLWKNDGIDQSGQNSKIGSDEASDGVIADVEAKETTETKEENKAEKTIEKTIEKTTEETTEETSEPPLDSNREEANMSDSDRSRPADNENPSEEGQSAQSFVEITGLSQKQKTLFLQSVQQLGLTNPRQLKRLDNCYSLLRLRYPDEDVDKNYYRLRMLIWLEYLHEQPSSLRCQFLSDWEQGRDFAIDDVEENDAFIEAKHHWNAVAANLPLGIQQTIYREVRCFILPAVNVLTSAKNNDKITEVSKANEMEGVD